LPGAETFVFEGDDRAVLSLHGFTGSTVSLRFVGETLNKAFGFTVSGPRLAGHGTSPNEMEKTGYLDWLASSESAMHELIGRKKQVYVAGLSSWTARHRPAFWG
jgi:carboxylesterase